MKEPNVAVALEGIDDPIPLAEPEPAEIVTPTRHIFVTGGVVSSLGKGVASATIGALLAARGFRVTIQKFDPYLNIDPGAMSLVQHGEVFVTDDGAETDLDLGHYERFLNRSLTGQNNLTQGRILWSLLRKERAGDFGGNTVQFVPHLTNEIKKAIRAIAPGHDVVITELGGTTGDIEGEIFLEAFRQFALEHGREYVAFVHLTLVPYIPTAGELKTKPTQHSVRELLARGIQPDMLLCRTSRRMGEDIRRKIALFTNVPPNAVIEAWDVQSIYDIPTLFHLQNVDALLCRRLNLPERPADMKTWIRIAQAHREPKRGSIKVAVIAQHADYEDAYKSLAEALAHGGIANDVRVEADWLAADALEGNAVVPDLSAYHGVLVPGGFGRQGVEGIISAIRAAREARIPFLGIGLGMQCAVIERARNVCGIGDATSAELDPGAEHRIIALLDERYNMIDVGGRPRVGAYPAVLKEGTRVRAIYGLREASERHRHRYEVNNAYREALEKAGLVISGTSPDGGLVEFVEDAEHPFFIGTIAHPEMKSRPASPHPLFVAFVKACMERRSASNSN